MTRAREIEIWALSPHRWLSCAVNEGMRKRLGYNVAWLRDGYLMAQITAKRLLTEVSSVRTNKTQIEQQPFLG